MRSSAPQMNLDPEACAAMNFIAGVFLEDISLRAAAACPKGRTLSAKHVCSGLSSAAYLDFTVDLQHAVTHLRSR